MLTKKNFKIVLNYVLGPILFLLISLSIYEQIKSQPNLSKHWAAILHSLKSEGGWMLVLTLCLMLVNWGIEAYKWKTLVNHLMPISYRKALLSVLAGVSFTMLTPNRMGEFLGRVLYLPDGSRIRAAALTALGSMSQLIITMIAGLVGVWLLQQHASKLGNWPSLLSSAIVFGTAFGLVITLLVYFNVGIVIRFIEKWPPVSKYAFFVHAVGEINSKELLKILAISALRYTVFLLQYYVAFYALHLQIPAFWMVVGTSAMFLILAIVPSASLAELGIRGQTSLFVFGMFTTDSLGILVGSGFIWLINIILPALAGSLILLSVKLFRKN